MTFWLPHVMSVGIHKSDIPYTAESEDALRKFDIYLHETDVEGTAPRPGLICFVHGGAWRSEDKHEHSMLARKLSSATGFSVAVPNYRLTPAGNQDPAYRHPMHAQDLLDFLHFILDWKDARCESSTQSLTLIGHSCGAHMLSSIFLESKEPCLEPSSRLFRSVTSIILSEGIYDVDLLLESFPTYRRWFIEPTFGPLESFAQFSATKFTLRPSSQSSIRWILLHSRGDRLVDMKQTVAMYDHLKRLHRDSVEINTDELEDGHNDILKTDAYVDMVKRYVGSFHHNSKM